MNLIFYKLARNKEKSNQFILISLNTTNKSIKSIRDQEDFLFISGNIKFFNLKNIYEPVLGVYNTKTNKIYLVHSLKTFLSDEIIYKYVDNQSLSCIQYQYELFSFLFKIKRIFNKTSVYLNHKDIKLYVDQFQLIAAIKYWNSSIESHEYFPLIYFNVQSRRLTLKYDIDASLNGYYVSITKTRNKELCELYKIHASQFNQGSLINTTQKHSKAFIVFIIIYIVLFFYGRHNFNFINYFEIIHTAIYDAFFIKYLKVEYYKIDDTKLDILYLLIFLIKLAELSYFLIIISKRYAFYYSGILVILAPIILFVSIEYIDEIHFYSYKSMLIVFSNLIIRIIYKVFRISLVNKNDSIFFIFLTCVRRFETSYCCLLYQNDIMLKQKNKNVMIFTYLIVVAQSLIILYQYYKHLIPYYKYRLKNLFKKKNQINNQLKLKMKTFDYFKTAPPPNSMCPICHCAILPTEKSMVTPCNHAFHEYCLRKSMHTQLICPYCRQNLPQFEYKEHFS